MSVEHIAIWVPTLMTACCSFWLITSKKLAALVGKTFLGILWGLGGAALCVLILVFSTNFIVKALLGNVALSVSSGGEHFVTLLFAVPMLLLHFGSIAPGKKSWLSALSNRKVAALIFLPMLGVTFFIGATFAALIDGRFVAFSTRIGKIKIIDEPVSSLTQAFVFDRVDDAPRLHRNRPTKDYLFLFASGERWTTIVHFHSTTLEERSVFARAVLSAAGQLEPTKRRVRMADLE